jgi:hypothetical protein
MKAQGLKEEEGIIEISEDGARKILRNIGRHVAQYIA